MTAMEPDTHLVKTVSLHKVYGKPSSKASRFFEALFKGLIPQKVWHNALKDINIAVHKGESLGILGKNGAGKTTLLSILAGSIRESSGKVERQGTNVAILSLGLGFNPNMTGRANAIQYCITLGMTQKEARAKMDDICAFAEAQDWINDKLSSYSSGMRGRLAFACVVHQNHDLLILDEALAVGDLSFRLKCYDYLKSVRKSGRSVVMVSHSPDTLGSLTDRIIVLDKGQVVYDGEPLDAIVHYKALRMQTGTSTDEALEVTPAQKDSIIVKEHAQAVQFSFTLRSRRDFSSLVLNIGMVDKNGVVVAVDELILPPRNGESGLALANGEEKVIKVSFENWLMPGRYRFTLAAYTVTPTHEKVPVCYIGKLQNIRIAGEMDEQNGLGRLTIPSVQKGI